MEVTLYVFVSWESQKRLKWERFESVGIQMEQRAFSRTAGIDTHAASAHNPHEHSRSWRSKICVNLCMGDSLSLPLPLTQCVCGYLMHCEQVCVCLYLQRRVQRLSNREGKEENLAAERQSVNYLLIQFGRWLPKKVEGSSVHSSKEERGDNLLFQSPSDSHLCLTKCLPPIPGLWAMPDCAATSLSLCSSVLLSFHIACLHRILRISSMSSRLSLFLSAWHSLLSPVPDSQCISDFIIIPYAVAFVSQWHYPIFRIAGLSNCAHSFSLSIRRLLFMSCSLSATLISLLTPGNTFKSCCLLFACGLSFCLRPKLEKSIAVKFYETGIIEKLCTRAS